MRTALRGVTESFPAVGHLLRVAALKVCGFQRLVSRRTMAEVRNWVLGPPQGVDSARAPGPRPVCPPGGTVGRPKTERLMGLPSRMCPLGTETTAWLSSGGPSGCRLEPEGFTLQGVFLRRCG